MSSQEFRIGDTRIVKVLETDLNEFTAKQLLPDFSPAMLIDHPDWIDPATYDAETGKVQMDVHTWVVRHGGKVIFVDTGAGNGKDRPTMPVLNDLHTPYLARLAEAGVQPEDVDYVLLTHLHADHAGWNTRWNGEQWAPTFPNAVLICSDLEWRYWAALDTGDEAGEAAVRAEAGFGLPVRTPVPGVFRDSLAPLETAERVKRIKVDGSEVLPGIRFLPAAGHSIDHAVIALESQGQHALFGGDLVHHPFELHDMNLTSIFCEFPDAARASRQKIVQHVLDTDAVYFSGHFPAASAGKITPSGESFGWEFLEPQSENVLIP